MQQLFVSVHIPKCAGTSFKTILRFIISNIFLDYDDKLLASNYSERKIQNLSEDLERNKKILSALKNSNSPVVVHGHFLATKYEYIFPDSKSLIWFRDPVERLASHYFFWQRTPDLNHDVCLQMINDKMSLKDFAAFKPMKNMYFRFLCSKTLESFDFIGLTEQFEKSVRLFSKMFNLNIDSSIISNLYINRNKERKSNCYDIDSATRQAIIINHDKDLLIYKKARYIFKELCAKYNID